MPCTHSASAPASAASSASAGLVTVTSTALPASRSAEMTAVSGQPNVKLTTGGGSASSAVILPTKSSSSQVPFSAAAPIDFRYCARSSASEHGRPGTKTFTPNAPMPASRINRISAAIAAAVL